MELLEDRRLLAVVTVDTESAISGNKGSSGGGIWAVGNVDIAFSTITNNQATIGGGGIWTSSDTSTSVLSHAIVAGNSRVTDGSPPVADDLAGNGTFELGYSLVGTAIGAINTTPGTINYFGVDPLLGPLANDGGPTQTHALLPGSPAIDAGDPTIQHDPDQFDQRGDPFLRVADGDLPDDIVIDMGAYEAQSRPSADFDSDHDVDGSDFLAWQRGYGTTVGAAKPDGNSDDDGDVDASDLAAWEVSFGNYSVPLVSLSVATDRSSALPSQQAATAAAFTLDLRAKLVDAAIAMDQSLRPMSGAGSAPLAPPGEDRLDWLPRRARWSQSLPWHGRSEIAEHLFRGQIDKTGDYGFYRDADDAVDRESIDELFAEGGVKGLL
jgi:hypothetical protein